MDYRDISTRVKWPELEAGGEIIPPFLHASSY
jgi:hypothetical protein